MSLCERETQILVGLWVINNHNLFYLFFPEREENIAAWWYYTGFSPLEEILTMGLLDHLQSQVSRKRHPYSVFSSLISYSLFSVLQSSICGFHLPTEAALPSTSPTSCDSIQWPDRPHHSRLSTATWHWGPLLLETLPFSSVCGTTSQGSSDTGCGCGRV